MPLLDLSDLNITISILGLFIVAYGFISIKIKQVWYLGEALPAVVIGICLGQVAARWIDPRDWGYENGEEQQNHITLGMCRIVIGVQLVIAGFQLPARYQLQRWKEMATCLLVIMTIMWFCTSACMYATVPDITWLAALVIGSCVTCTDPILSQAVAKGPFADKYVKRPLREIISSEAGANDGFGFPFLMLATYLIRYAANPTFDDEIEPPGYRTGVDHGGESVGRLGGGVAAAMQMWFVETWIYFILMSIVYGAVCGLISMYAVKYALKHRWIDGEMFLLWPTGLGLFMVGTCGMLGTDDLLACFVAGNFLNWNGQYLDEAETRHDEVNSCVDVLLNFGGFMYIGAIIPWAEFSDPDGTGLTWGRLIGLGFMILAFRRIPAVFALYKLLPSVIQDWKDALFMGYFGPIGIGAVFYVEHARHLFPHPGEANTDEENTLAAVMAPTVYFLVFFSIVVHGLSIPALNSFLKYRGVQPIQDEEGPVQVEMLSRRASVPKNARVSQDLGRRSSVAVNNRFSRGPSMVSERRWPVDADDDDSLSLVSGVSGLGRNRSGSRRDSAPKIPNEPDDWNPVRKYVTEPSAARQRPREIMFADEGVGRRKGSDGEEGRRGRRGGALSPSRMA